MPTTTAIRDLGSRAPLSGQRLGERLFVERGLVRGVLATIILLFIPGLLDPFDPPKAIVLRVVGVSALAGVLLHALAHLKSRAVTMRKLLPSGGAAKAVDVGVAGWAVASLVSTAFSVSPRLSVLGELQQRDGLVTTLGLVGMYALVRRSHQRAEHMRSTIDVVLASAAIAAGYALVQFAGHDPLAWAGTTHYASGVGVVLRPFGTLGNPILLGAVLAPALGIVTVRLVTGRGRNGWWIVLSGLFAVGLLATLSRGAWLSGACGVVAAAAGAAWYRIGRPARESVLALLAAAIAPASAAAWLLRGPLLARASEPLTAEPGSALVRREIASAALALWRTRPWLGTGPDTFGLLFPRVQPLAYGGGLWNGLPIQAHSVALQILATMGLLGALCGALWIAALFVPLLGRPSNGAAGPAQLEPVVGCVSLVIFGAFNHVGIAGAALFVALSAMTIRGSKDARAVVESARWTRAAFALAFALAILLASSALPEFEALAAAGRARNLLQRSVGTAGEARWALLRAAAGEAAGAAAHAPGEDELWRSACDAERALGREALRRNDLTSAGAALERAEMSARRAVGLEPLRATNLQAMGTALALRARLASVVQQPVGEVQAIATRSDSAFAEARRRAPLDALILIDQARGQLELGRATEARVTAQRIVQLYPHAATGYSLLAAAQLLAGDRVAATTSLRAAVRGRWLEDQGADELAAKSYLRQLDSPDSTR